MTQNQDKLIKLLKEMFQFDQSDLDFGIYRIMNLKRNEINDYLENKLIPQIAKGLEPLAAAGREVEIKKIEQDIASTLAMPIADEYKKPILAELEAKKKAISSSNISDVEGDIYTHLINFFSRYYDDGDFISQRRYKDGVYAIPYEGEEVKLYWANADQYYVKTSEYFKDYTFKSSHAKTVHFKVVDAEVERDNNKANAKRFFQICGEKPFEFIENELVIYFEYTIGDKKQDAYNADAVAVVQQGLKDNMEYFHLFTVADRKAKCELAVQLYRYTAKNTFDYFIHKDLKKFLMRELDFYIKNEVLYLDDITVDDMSKTKEYLVKAQTIKNVAGKIITFLAQIEDFQKKMYLKKKLVVETNYCITLDRIPETFYPEIVANDAQREEWIKLFAIDEIESTESTLVDAGKVGYSSPLTVDFLKDNPYLVLDTAFFSDTFKQLLVEQIDNLDENLDGLLIHCDNFQALRLLQHKYSQRIDCIYGDPPYNAKSSEILYKNSYKHSSWISMMRERVQLSASLKTKTGVIVTAIDENEGFNVMKLYDTLFPNWTKTVVTVLHNPAGVQGDNFSYSHEYAIFLFENMKHIIGKIDLNEESVEPFRDWGPSGTRNPNGDTFYPIFVDLAGEKIIGIGESCPPSFHPGNQNIRCVNHVEVYPVGEDGVERKWVFERKSVDDILEDLFVINNNGIYQIKRNKSKGSYKTVWMDNRYYANIYGSKLLNDILGGKHFDFPKSVYTVEDCISAVNDVKKNKNSIILDYFAGSGTTGHAVINLNKADNGHRKYVLIEMGEHFDTATKPRIERITYSADTGRLKGWKDGKPVSRVGSSHAFKYLRLESYEDTLNNIKIEGELDLDDLLGEEYMLKYMMDNETEHSVFNVEMLTKPFDYHMNITRKQECKSTAIDLVESFNYLIGLVVERSFAIASYDATFETGAYGAVTAKIKKGDTYRIKLIEGHNLIGEKILVVWRELTGDQVKDNAVLDAVLEKKKISTTDFEFDKIYVNGDNNLQNLSTDVNSYKVILIEEEMKKRMFE